mgnify:FL=1
MLYNYVKDPPQKGTSAALYHTFLASSATLMTFGKSLCVAGFPQGGLVLMGFAVPGVVAGYISYGQYFDAQKKPLLLNNGYLFETKIPKPNMSLPQGDENQLSYEDSLF